MKQILVYENWRSETPTLIGRLFVEGTRGKEVCSFEYDSKWLKQSSGFILDPDLSLFNGRQFAPVGKELFGIFEDSCPDRWGRTLMDRREMILARSESRKPRSLTESDYLLGVHDMSRMGALRFKTEESGQFLSDNSDLAAPPWVALRKLNDAVANFEKDPNKADKWMQMLIAPGSSLGGARPKANVVAPDGSLWIAKFPSKKDKINCSAWEKTTYELAKMCGLSVVDCCLEKFSKFGSTFLVKRFDRELDRRIHFTSAMALLGCTDGDYDSGYLDIAAFIKSSGVSPKKDLLELWKRIVFNILISNTDDHLRNHGFLLTEKGWTLSPLFDVNPNPYGENLSLNISETDSSLSIDLAISVCEFFGVKSTVAKSTIAEMKKIVKENWSSIATSNGISRSEQSFMESAFVESK